MKRRRGCHLFESVLARIRKGNQTEAEHQDSAK